MSENVLTKNIFLTLQNVIIELALVSKIDKQGAAGKTGLKVEFLHPPTLLEVQARGDVACDSLNGFSDSSKIQ